MPTTACSNSGRTLQACKKNVLKTASCSIAGRNLVACKQTPKASTPRVQTPKASTPRVQTPSPKRSVVAGGFAQPPDLTSQMRNIQSLNKGELKGIIKNFQIPSQLRGEVIQVVQNFNNLLETNQEARDILGPIMGKNLPMKRPSGAQEIFDVLGVKDLAGLRQKRELVGLASIEAIKRKGKASKDPRDRPRDPSDGKFPMDIVEDKIEEIYEQRFKGAYKKEFLTSSKEKQDKIRKAFKAKLSLNPHLFM
jgi:hypothetical protein